MTPTITDLAPKDSQSLCNLVLDIEKNTGLNFPNQVRDNLIIKYLGPSCIYKKVLEVCENSYGRQLSEGEKISVKKQCEDGKTFGLANCIKDEIYIFTKNIEDSILAISSTSELKKKELTDIIASLITVHELGHIFLHYTTPEFGNKFKTLNGTKLHRVMDLNESFANYVMLKYYTQMRKGVNGGLRRVIERFIEVDTNLTGHIDSMFLSDNPLSYVRERLEECS